MSRTDHHRPYLVRAADPLEPGRYARHYHELRTYRMYYGVYHVTKDVCDLGDHPYAHWRSNERDDCTWEIGWAFRPYSRKSTREERRAYYFSGERRRVKNMARDVVKSYRTPLDVLDWDFDNRQHRHSTDWNVM